jgi:hypothetical protein
MSQKNRNTLKAPLPRDMREAEKMGYLPLACAWEYEIEFISENEMIVTGLAQGFDVDETLTEVDEEGRSSLPDFKVRFTAHYTFGPIKATEKAEACQRRIEALGFRWDPVRLLWRAPIRRSPSCSETPCSSFRTIYNRL